jgi:phage shock protein C
MRNLARRRLYRSSSDSWIGGVCGGLGKYFGIDADIIRLIWIVSIFAGFGLGLYIILWIIMPRGR